jgi:hypothetical protein
VTIYALPENESRVRKLQRARRWLVASLVVILPIATYLCINSRGRPAELWRIPLLACLAVLLNLWNPLSKRDSYKKKAAGLRIKSFEVDSTGLRMNGMRWSRLIPWGDVVRIEEPANGRGLYVRTHRRFFWYLIPRRIDRYNEMRSDLAAAGVPIVQASAPWNWGILFVILYCASLLFNLLTQDRRILACNFAFAVILGCAGAFVTRFGTFGSSGQFRIRSMLGSFVPAALSAVAVIYPFGIR